MQRKAKRVVLSEGETIGHKHVLKSEADIEYEVLPDSITMELKVLGVLTHEEHDRIVLPQSKYRKYNQVEFNPMDGTVTRVFD